MIRSPTDEDLCRLAEIHVCGWRWAYRGIASDYELFTERQVIKSIAMFKGILLDGASKIDVFEDEAAGIIKGFALHGPVREGDELRVYEIFALYVQPEFAGGGVGSALLLSVERGVDRGLFDRMVIWALENNDRAIAFYEKHGFEKDGNIKPEESWNTNEVRLSKQLD